jgi:BirA family biotin operon repressor/biotin-[acetyl-CoA-carboxylase] ligase
VQIKWPNDVVLEDRKLAGVLCEARWTGERLAWVAVGVGINVRGPLASDIAAKAIALNEVAPGLRRIDVLRALVPRLHTLSDAPVMGDQERELFQQLDWLAGRRVSEPVNGTARGVDSDGALLIETGRGLERVTGGGVECS